MTQAPFTRTIAGINYIFTPVTGGYNMTVAGEKKPKLRVRKKKLEKKKAFGGWKNVPAARDESSDFMDIIVFLWISGWLDEDYGAVYADEVEAADYDSESVEEGNVDLSYDSSGTYAGGMAADHDDPAPETTRRDSVPEPAPAAVEETTRSAPVSAPEPSYSGGDSDSGGGGGDD